MRRVASRRCETRNVFLLSRPRVPRDYDVSLITPSLFTAVIRYRARAEKELPLLLLLLPLLLLLIEPLRRIEFRRRKNATFHCIRH